MNRVGTSVVLWVATMSLAQAADGVCDRKCLRDVTDQYLSALIARAPKRAPVDPAVKATENTQPVKVGEGIWTTATALGTYRIYLQDPGSGNAVFMGVVREGDESTMLVVRLKAPRGRITEIETVVTRFGFPGEAGQAPAKVEAARTAFSVDLPRASRADHDTLVRVANSYYEGIEHGSAVPFAKDCRRIENGVAVNHNPSFDFGLVAASGAELPNFGAMSCAEQFDAQLWNTDTITERRFPIVDTERGLVLVMASYNVFVKGRCAESPKYGRVCPKEPPPGPVALNMAELFRIHGGEIHEIESMWTAVPYPTSPGWPTSTGAPVAGGH